MWKGQAVAVRGGWCRGRRTHERGQEERRDEEAGGACLADSGSVTDEEAGPVAVGQDSLMPLAGVGDRLELQRREPVLADDRLRGGTGWVSGG